MLFHRGTSSVENCLKSLHLSFPTLQIIIQNLRGLGLLPFLLEQDEEKINSLAVCTITMNMQLFHFVPTFTLFESKYKPLRHLKLSCEDETDPTRKSYHSGIRGLTEHQLLSQQLSSLKMKKWL